MKRELKAPTKLGQRRDPRDVMKLIMVRSDSVDCPASRFLGRSGFGMRLYYALLVTRKKPAHVLLDPSSWTIVRHILDCSLSHDTIVAWKKRIDNAKET